MTGLNARAVVGGGSSVAQVDASVLKIDVLPPKAPRFIDPGPRSRQERDEIGSRAPPASCAGIQSWLASRKKCCTEDIVSFATCHRPGVVARL